MKSNSFLQSPEWGEFQRLLGNKPNVVGDTQYYIVSSSLFSYIYVPRGPVIKPHEDITSILNELKTVAAKASVDYMLIEPDTDFLPFVHLLKDQGFFPHKPSIQPTTSLIMSLNPDKDALFSSIRKTARAEIRRAREHVTVTSNITLDHWDRFVELLSETTERQNFFGHSPSYLKKQFESFAKNSSAKLYFAEVNKKIVAGAIIVYASHTATYLHAASSHEGRKFGAPHLLLWNAIGDAKNAGKEEFDFWGIAPENVPDHPWAGITIFKKGFGGTIITYPGSFAFPVNPLKYKFYLLTTFLRAIPIFKTIQRILLRTRTTG